jgi:uncharacterized NAD-dependent epimerase/dehydratase family protein
LSEDRKLWKIAGIIERSCNVSRTLDAVNGVGLESAVLSSCEQEFEVKPKEKLMIWHSQQVRPLSTRLKMTRAIEASTSRI